MRRLVCAGFILLWLGQLVSLMGSGLTGFALGVWVYQRTGSLTQFALINLFTSLPGIVFAPFAGALVDRWDRRRVMIASDSGSALCTLVLLLMIRGRSDRNLAHLPGPGDQLDFQRLSNAGVLRVDHAPGAEAALCPGKRHGASGASGISDRLPGARSGAARGPRHRRGLHDRLRDVSRRVCNAGHRQNPKAPSEPRGAARARVRSRQEAAYGWKYIRSGRGCWVSCSCSLGPITPEA